MISASEGIGFGACVIAAMALVSYLIYLKASSQGHPRGVIRRGLVTIWLCLGTGLAVLIAARAALGGPLFDVNLGQGRLWWQPVAPAQMIILAGAVATVVGLALVALRAAHNLQEPAPHPDDDQEAAEGNLPS